MPNLKQRIRAVLRLRGLIRDSWLCGGGFPTLHVERSHYVTDKRGQRIGYAAANYPERKARGLDPDENGGE